jgi:hypothetical protein
MAKYATGKHAKAISDRSGVEFPYREMVREWNGSFVHVSEFEPKQPQLEPKPISADGIALRNVRSDRTENAVPYALPDNPFETLSSGSGIINVTAPGHGLTNGTTYRFRGPDGARVSTDYAVANFFFFTVDTNTATIGGVKGGGTGCSVGPVTLSA